MRILNVLGCITLTRSVCCACIAPCRSGRTSLRDTCAIATCIVYLLDCTALGVAVSISPRSRSTVITAPGCAGAELEPQSASVRPEANPRDAPVPLTNSRVLSQARNAAGFWGGAPRRRLVHRPAQAGRNPFTGTLAPPEAQGVTVTRAKLRDPSGSRTSVWARR